MKRGEGKKKRKGMETMALYGLKWFCMDFWILYGY